MVRLQLAFRCADSRWGSRNRYNARYPIEHALNELPHDYHVLPIPEGHLVVGPTGTFALTYAGPGKEEDAAVRIAHAANELRHTLIRQLSWTSLVTPIVVVDGLSVQAEAALVVPIHLLIYVITFGRRLLDYQQIERALAALATAFATTDDVEDDNIDDIDDMRARFAGEMCSVG